MPAQPPFMAIPKWDSQLIADPPAIFRGAPFWSWNGKLEKDRLLAQLEVFKAMGMGGGTIHVRTGMTTTYLSDEFMRYVKASADKAEQLGMLTWLYDEDRWPSGFAGGLVTNDRALRCRHLMFTFTRPEPGEVRMHPIHHGPAQPVTERTFVAAWALRFENKQLASSRRIAEKDAVQPGEIACYAYTEIAPDWSWFNGQQYANLLDPKAIKRFIETTYDRYAEVLGERFGKTVPTIFTDEPLFRDMQRPLSWDDRRDQRVAWVDDFPQTYRQQFNEDVFDRLPAVLFDAADGSSRQARWRFHDHHTQRFADAFARQVGAWCQEHNIALTGHMMSEQSLALQTMWVGEVMRSLHHFQLPGIDLLCDNIEYTTAKQAQSCARQNGRPGTLSELYGVTNWDFPFAGHLRQGNWQAALGVVVRVHHLSWYSMAGEAKRDYPASIGWHSPWWREYRAVEDHFARVNVALQTGKPVCRVAMLHPIESHWVTCGPTDAHADEQALLAQGFSETLAGMLEGQIDADLVSEALLPTQGEQNQPGRLRVGEMAYEVLVIPPVLTIRSTTLDRLETFVSQGGTVILLGDAPALVDGVPSPRAVRAAESWKKCPLATNALLTLLAPWRDVELVKRSRRVRGPVYQLREEEDGSRVLFLCSTNKVPGQLDGVGATLRLRGHHHLELIDTQTGATTEPGEQWTDDGWTELPLDLDLADHRLLRLRPARQTTPIVVTPRWREHARLGDPVNVTLSEPNVLLLDRCAWSLDDGAWQAADEVLRVDNHVRRALGLPHRHGDISQPWALPDPEPSHHVALRFAVRCDVAVKAPRLALERVGEATVSLDGTPVAPKAEGFYVDEDIATIALPDLSAGEHELVVRWPFRPGYGLEACYLLGDFGVSVAGMHTRIIAPVRQLAFGDFTTQGLPFYGGNVTYHCPVELPDEPTALRVAKFNAPLLAIEVGGRRIGQIIRAPHRMTLAGVTGRTQLDIICFGDRGNTFGALHNCNPQETWRGPNSYRSANEHWTDGYVINPKGVTVAPILEVHARPGEQGPRFR